MVWFLFIHSDKDFKDIEITFSYGHNNSYDKTFLSSDYPNLSELELRIIEIMNLNVSLRNRIYAVCDIRSGVYEYLYDKMPKLFSRTSGVIDLQSFVILNDIKIQGIEYPSNLS